MDGFVSGGSFSRSLAAFLRCLQHTQAGAKRSGLANTQSAENNKIWSMSSTKERERTKEFWLGLSEEECKNLVKVEKEAVLKKMKEQQRHSCSCAVCSRKVSIPLPLIFSPEFFP